MDYAHSPDAIPGPLLHKMCVDMKVVGTITIITGVLYCLSIIGAIVGIPVIIAGIRLRESAGAFSNYIGSNDVSRLVKGFERQSRFFFIVNSP